MNSPILDYLKALNDPEMVCLIGNQILEAQGLTDWSCVVDNRPSVRRGQCRYGEREIGISGGFIETTPGLLILDTVLHEVAHALNRGDGHGDQWRATFRSLGGSGRRTDPEKSFTTSVWEALCNDCGATHGWQRKPKYAAFGYRCRKCGGHMAVRDTRPERQAKIQRDVAGIDELIARLSAKNP